MSLLCGRTTMTFEDFEAFATGTGRKAGGPAFDVRYTSTAWGIGRLGDATTKWFGRSGPTAVFESRVFGTGFDMHWTQQGRDGDVVCWIDTDLLTVDPGLSGDVNRIEVVEKLSRRYELWGKVDRSNPEGVVLSDGRVGQYEIPVTGSGRTVWLETIEYLKADVDGNCVIVAECLQGFTVGA